MEIFDLMSERNHEQLVFWNDPDLGYRGIIAIHDTTLGPALGGTRSFFLGADVSPALLAVGYIVKLEVAIQLFLGGAIGWLVLIPLAPEIVGVFAPDSAPLVHAASAAFDSGTSTLLPSAAALSAAGKTPGTARISPLSANSP